MALINCPECGKEISDKATACPNCGFPIAEYIPANNVDAEIETEEKIEDTNCPYCGSSYIDDDGYCGECGMRQTGYSYENKEMPVKQMYIKHRKKEISKAGIICFVLGIISMLTCWFFIGVFPAVIGFVLGVVAYRNRDKQHKLTKAGIALNTVAMAIAVFIFAIVLLAGSDETESKGEHSETQDVETQRETGEAEQQAAKEAEEEQERKAAEERAKEEAEERAKEEAEEKAKKFEYADVDIEYLKSEVGYNEFDDKCLFVYFQMTNNSDENRAFSYFVTVDAFQNGIEMETNYFYDCEEEENGTKEIRPGSTITVAEVFELGDSTDNVILEVRPFNIWSDKLLFEKEISITE